MNAASLGDRSLFPDLRFQAYLNHAAVSPYSGPVVEAVAGMAKSMAAEGLGGAIEAAAMRNEVRSKLGGLLGVDSGIGLVPNTTTGVTNIAMSIRWNRGDRVLLFDEEFPANVTPWQQAAAEFGLRLELVPTAPFLRDHEEGLAELERRIGAEPVRLIAVSLVQFHLGLRMPVEAIARAAHEAGGEVFVDGIQGIGVLPVSATNLDYLACGGHKWLMGAEGAGFLYVRPEAAARLAPRLAGWISHRDAWRFLFEGEGHLRYDRGFKDDASLFEGGAQNNLGYAALGASLDLIQSIGVEAIAAHVQRYHDAVEPALVDRGFESFRHRMPEGRSGSLCVRPPAGVDVLELAAHLRDRGVSVATPDGKLRLAPHWPNSAEREVPDVLKAIDEKLGRVH